MTKREKAYIKSRVNQYRRWAAEAAAEARREPRKEFRDELYFQARLNESAADTVALLLDNLEEMSRKNTRKGA